jgi:arylsulfatase
MKKWHGEAIKYNVYPLYDDVAARPANVQKRGGTSNTYTYYPPGAEFIHEALSPPVKNRGHAITASVETDGKTEGVIVAAGGYFSGYTLYVRQNIVTYSYNAFDQNYYRIEVSKPLRAGKHEIKFVYEVVAGADPSKPTGKGTIFIDNEKVGESVIERTVPGLFSVSEPFDVAADNGGSVDRKAYTSPYRFSDTLNWVRFDLDPDW